MPTATLDWNAIQERNIDPFSPVDSDNMNKLLKILGSHKAYISGFDVTFTRDGTSNKMYVNVSRGIGVVGYVVIEMTQPSVVELFACPVTERTIYLVLDYKYQKIEPVPIASLKAIRAEEFDETRHLKLFMFHLGNWSTVPTLEDWETHLAGEGNYDDLRKADDSIPEWATNAFVKKGGDTLTGPLLLADVPITSMEAATKGYIDNLIANHDSEHYDVFVKLSGSVMTGALTLSGAPTTANHAATKEYVDNYVNYVLNNVNLNYVTKTGDTMLGMLRLFADPTVAMDAATKQYVDAQIAGHDTQHDDRFLRLAGGTLTGALTLSGAPTAANHAATKAYVDSAINGGHNHDSVYVNVTGDSMTGNLNFKAAGVVLQNYVSSYYDAVRLTSSIDTGLDVGTLWSDDKLVLACGPTDGSGNIDNMRISFKLNGSEVSYVYRYGLVGAKYSADVVEFFEHDLEQMPEMGACVVLNEEGKVVLSNDVCLENVLGLVSYEPGLILGGTDDFETEFENGRIPVALLGQIDNVCVVAQHAYPAGCILVSGYDGTIVPFNDTTKTYAPGCIVAKALQPIVEGINSIKVVIYHG